ncbi:NADH-quinone oxidoreductase subunit NuoH [Infirmifilum lucidum]|uniref:NADH-quinone oxidoreductase subunit NuoH n=1 Tax=Infirmifilum lucidum TaxID=2776706 RepID=A0A7L9FHN9_9CREN|nr:NADH-quinone oxidoreductase subunit NuoH [Infirmifilum lucidum]QOJ79320.1 NADH-quinone oxidoreductase subunit NuoH [Infirmifilum lucidum]
MDVAGVLPWVLRLLLSPQVFAPVVFPGLATALVVLLTVIWAERKIAARVQMRVGPLYVTRRLGGVLQMLADGTRYMFQEFIIPVTADRVPFLFAPILALTLAIIPFAFIPSAPGFSPIKSPYSLPAALAAISAIPLSVLLMGWASNNKFAIQGAVREAFMGLAYEAVVFISALSMGVLYGTLDLEEAVARQWLPGIVLNPVAAFTFFVGMVMSAGRLPFDIVEGEQEIVAGPFVEYSGIIFGIGMGLAYLKLYSLSLLYTLLFLSGWEPLVAPLYSVYPGIAGIFLFVKAYLLMLFVAFLRSVYGRYRLDQALRAGWRVFLPLSLISLLISVVVKVVGCV